MSQALVDKVNKTSAKSGVPEIRTGYTVRVHQKIKEGGKERIQIFEGLVIRVNSGNGVDKTFTVRRIVSGVGVEKIFTIYSPNIAQIEIVKKAKVRRAKMYYMRNLTGKRARLRETYLSDGDDIVMDAASEEKAKEESIAQAKAEAEAKAVEEAKAKEEAEKKAAEEKAAKEAEMAKETNESEEEASQEDAKTPDAPEASEETDKE